MAKLTSKVFTSSGSWTAPAGVTSVIVVLFGGGAGGRYGNATNKNFPGGCSIKYTHLLTVTPNTTYTVTVGSGGQGGIVSGAAVSGGGPSAFGTIAYAYGAGIPYGGYGGFTGYARTYVIHSSPFGRAASGLYYGGGGAGGFGGFHGPDSYGGGGGGGIGGDGYNSASAAGAAGNGAANTGSGGGAGGVNIGAGANGNGGNGGSGKVTVIWVE